MARSELERPIELDQRLVGQILGDIGEAHRVVDPGLVKRGRQDGRSELSDESPVLRGRVTPEAPGGGELQRKPVIGIHGGALGVLRRLGLAEHEVGEERFR